MQSCDEAQRFAHWEIRPRERVLIVGGEPVRIGSRAFDVLWALVQRAGLVVAKAELLDAAWPGLVVEENNLSVQISTLRKVLGPSAIVNVAGRGYKLAAPAAQSALADTFSAPSSPSHAQGAVDAAHALVGRDAELATLTAALGRAPLLSLVGMGGVGKTAMARALLATSTQRWRDGQHWIDLSGMPHGAPLLSLVARTLGVLPDDAGLASGDVLRSLAQLQALIVLDSCEHLLDPVTACLAPLLRAAPGLRWLVTSQEPLRLAGEFVCRLAPLDVAATGATLDEAQACGAVELFALRAHAVDQAFALDAGNVATVLDLCRALDGLPLALEMAAARVPTLGLRGVHEQLRRRLRLRSALRDAPQRQQTLHDTFAWSYGLLSPGEQQLFRSLQPFQGGFTTLSVSALVRLQSGEAGRAALDADPINTLETLIDKSLVQRMQGNASGAQLRYRLLESARDFAAHQLAEAGETDAARTHHAEVVAGDFDPAWDELLIDRDAAWLARYLPERDNVRAALAWACSSEEPALLARLVTACGLLDRVAQTEAQVLHASVPLETLHQAPPALRARACLELGWAQFLEGNRDVGTSLIEQALVDHEYVGDMAGAYLALVWLIRLYLGRPGLRPDAQALWDRLALIDPAHVPLRLRVYCESTVTRHFSSASTPERLRQLGRIARQAGFDTQAATCETGLTDALLLRGSFEEVVAVADQGLAQWHGSLLGWAFVNYNKAHALVRLGRVEDARAAARHMLRTTPGQAHMVIDLFALAAAQSSLWEDAALMFGCSARIKRERDWSADPAEAQLIGETFQALRSALDADELARLFALGAAMAVPDVLAFAGLASDNQPER